MVIRQLVLFTIKHFIILHYYSISSWLHVYSIVMYVHIATVEIKTHDSESRGHEEAAVRDE